MVTREQQAIAETVDAVGARQPRPSLGAIWRALAEVRDPEVPVVSVLDLGIVRAAEWDALDPTLLVMRITPTYSGCPATDVIAQTIREQLLALGVPGVRIDTVLSPAWSTQFLTPEAQRQLRAYGIAPPGAARPAATPIVDVRGLSPLRRPGEVVACPRCGSLDTELVSRFGSTSCKAQYRCRECLEPFDFFKPL